MGVLFVIFGIGAFVLFLLSRIPGLEHLVKPMIQVIVDLLKMAVENMWTWGIYGALKVFHAHRDLFRHLTQTAVSIDPTIKYEMQETPPEE